jgi:transcriptional regulator GlxA family with amidase domain
VYLDYRSHLNPDIHKVQSWIANHPAEKCSIESLSLIAAMSPRHLTRVFKKETGITIKEYAHRLKFELARNLMCNPEMTLDAISKECGFDDPRQFRRLWKTTFGRPLLKLEAGWLLELGDVSVHLSRVS